MYKIMSGIGDWNNLTNVQQADAEILIAGSWRNDSSTFINLGNGRISKKNLILAGCEFRIPEPREWVIERTEAGHIVRDYLNADVTTIITAYPIGTRFKLSVVGETRYKVSVGTDAWDALGPLGQRDREIKIGCSWLNGCCHAVNIGSKLVDKSVLVGYGCEFRTPLPSKWVITHIDDDWTSYTIDNDKITSIRELLSEFPVGTTFKLVQLEDVTSPITDDYIKQAQDSIITEQEKFDRFCAWHSEANNWSAVVSFHGLSDSDTEWFIKKLKEFGLYEQAEAVEAEVNR